MNRRRMLAAMACVLGLQSEAHADSAEPLRPFMMMDVNGTLVTDENLRNRYSMVFFGYTHCPDICPTTLNTIATVLKTLGKDGDKILPLFVTLDPERDTPKLMSQYSQNFDERIVPLHGPKAFTDAMAKAFGVQYEVKPTSDTNVYTIDHTASMAFVGPDTVIIKRYLQQEDAASIAADMAAIMAQAPAGP